MTTDRCADDAAQHPQEVCPRDVKAVCDLLRHAIEKRASAGGAWASLASARRMGDSGWMTSAGWPVVALVTSAGGLEAMSAVLGSFPAGFPATVIALQHSEPEHISTLPEILASRCDLPVAHAHDGEALAPGVVVVAPPGRHLLVTPQWTSALIKSGRFPPNRPSADLLLTSMALSLQHRAIAVVLSGGGHDGATGATAIHDFGGAVIASDEQSSHRFDMPAAVIDRDHAVDMILPLDDIGPVLIDIVAQRT